MNLGDERGSSVRAIRLFGKVARLAGDLILPPLCAGCARQVATPDALCSDCWRALNFIAAPLCDACGLPFEIVAAPDALCASCLASPPRFDRARAAIAYDDASRPLIIGFKHADRTHQTALLANLMARAGRALLRQADVLVPVPLHRRRLIARRYNQAALLAAELGRRTDKVADPGLLTRINATPSQGTLSPEARRRNVAGAFGVRGNAREPVAGRRVLLIDDVFTTGATVEACSRVLHRAGAAQIDVLTVARVIRPRPV